MISAKLKKKYEIVKDRKIALFKLPKKQFFQKRTVMKKHDRFMFFHEN